MLVLIIIVNGLFAIKLSKDLIKNRQQLKNEPGHNLLLAIASPIIFFLSSIGVSDFAVSTVFYRKAKLITDKLLPGTLNTQCVIPVAAMALTFISTIKVDTLTLSICIISQVIGAYFGSRFISKLSLKSIRKLIGTGLIIATTFIIASKLSLIPSGGTAFALSPIKLAIAAMLLSIFGALNNMGIGSYAPTMVTVYALGMDPVAAFPIIMGASTFSIPIGSIQFIKRKEYSRKITLFAATFGLLGVLVGVCFIRKLDISMLQWLIAAILLYSGTSMLIDEFKTAKTRSSLC